MGKGVNIPDLYVLNELEQRLNIKIDEKVSSSNFRWIIGGLTILFGAVPDNMK